MFMTRIAVRPLVKLATARTLPTTWPTPTCLPLSDSSSGGLAVRDFGPSAAMLCALAIDGVPVASQHLRHAPRAQEGSLSHQRQISR